MQTNAKKFVDKDGKSVWTSETNDIVSMCVEVNEESLDMNTLFVREEKSLVWLKGNSVEAVTRNQDAVIASINKGLIRPYRAFSETPFYEGQEQDINPTTNAQLGRYSQVRLCPADKHTSLHRQFVTVATPVVVAEQPKVGADVEQA